MPHQAKPQPAEAVMPPAPPVLASYGAARPVLPWVMAGLVHAAALMLLPVAGKAPPPPPEAAAIQFMLAPGFAPAASMQMLGQRMMLSEPAAQRVVAGLLVGPDPLRIAAARAPAPAQAAEPMPVPAPRLAGSAGAAARGPRTPDGPGAAQGQDDAAQIAALSGQVAAAVQQAAIMPPAAIRQGRAGRAQVGFTYVDGAAEAVSLLQSSQSRFLDAAAVTAVRSAHYPGPPPKLRAQRIPMQVWVHFGLGQSAQS